jgi:3-oxoacyl-[acyl-carrier-protein] synthase I
LTVHAVPAVAELRGLERLVALLADALRDLGTQTPLEMIGSGMGVFLALPDPEARLIHLTRTAAEQGTREVENADTRRTRLARQLLALAGSAVGLDLRSLPMRAFGGAQAAFAAAAAAASQAVETRAVRAALVVAVDSLASPETLELLLDQRRIKTDENPVGFMAGEAAAAMVLTKPSSSSNAAAPAALLGTVEVARETHPLGADRPSDGRALAECLRRALGPPSPKQPAPFLVADHDGENHRAQEFGMALWHLTKGKSPLSSSRVWIPAKSFGNVGAAYGGLAACLAARAFARGYAPAPSALIFAAADDGARAACQVIAP